MAKYNKQIDIYEKIHSMIHETDNAEDVLKRIDIYCHDEIEKLTLTPDLNAER